MIIIVYIYIISKVAMWRATSDGLFLGLTRAPCARVQRHESEPGDERQAWSGGIFSPVFRWRTHAAPIPMLLFRCRRPARMAIFFSSASSDGAIRQNPSAKARGKGSLSHPSLVTTSASIWLVSSQWVAHTPSIISRTWATRIFTRLSDGCPASFVMVLSRLFASVKPMTGFKANSAAR